MSLPQQLQWNKKKIAYLANKKLAQEKQESTANLYEEKKVQFEEEKKEEAFNPNADLSSMTLAQQLAWNKQNLIYKNEQRQKAKEAEKKEEDEFGFDEETSKNLTLESKDPDYLRKRTNINVRHGLLPDVEEVSNDSALKKSATVNDSLFDQIAQRQKDLTTNLYRDSMVSRDSESEGQSTSSLW